MSLSLRGRHGVVMDSVEKAEHLMIFGVTLHIFGGGEGGWIRGRRGSLG